MAESLTTLKDRLDAIYLKYQTNFAGKPRATRDLALLDQILEDLQTTIESLRTLLNGSRNPGIVSILENATENLVVYRNERKAIEDVQSNPSSIDAAKLGQYANGVFGIYTRHFAGKDRTSRDLGLLDEMIERLEAVESEMEKIEDKFPAVSKELDSIATQRSMYTQEREHIANARRSGTMEERVSRYAQMANKQFDWYRKHFAGKPRPTRRAELLERISANLREIQVLMQEIGSHPTNQRNQGIVEQNLASYVKEIVEIRKAKDEASPQDLAGWLGQAANEVMAIYREQFAGKSRKTRNLETIDTMCDAMAEIAFQMMELAETHSIDTNEKNLDIVMDAWVMYESEYREIVNAQRSE